jgi:two-component system sensor histidine kinase DesK
MTAVDLPLQSTGRAAAVDEQTLPILAAMSRWAIPRRWERTAWLNWLLAMLGFLAYPVGDLLTRGFNPVLVALVLALLAAHATTWVRTLWLALATTAPFRTTLPWLVADTVVVSCLAFSLHGQFETLFIYASIAFAVSLPLRWALPAIAAATAAAFLVDLPVPVDVPLNGGPASTIFSQLSFVFFLGLMMLFYRRSMLLILELRRARQGLAQLAVSEERLRIARDLHDLLGHSLTTISLKSQLALRLAGNDPQVSREIADIHEVAQAALIDVRQTVTGYRRTHLADELQGATAMLRAAAITTHVDVHGADLPPNIESLLGWIVREGCTNIVRHSRARHASITLELSPFVAELIIEDDGIGGDFQPGNGLSGLSERVFAANGSLSCEPMSQGGFRLLAQIPFLAAEIATGAASSTSREIRDAR